MFSRRDVHEHRNCKDNRTPIIKETDIVIKATWERLTKESTMLYCGQYSFIK